MTGASKGIGLAVVRALLDEGASVVAGARSTESLDGLERVTAVAVDLAAPEGPARLVERAIDEHGRVDVLVNNVGAVRLRLEGFLGTSDEEFEWAMQMNFFTALRATRAALGPDAGAGWRHGRERGLGQRLLPTRRRDDRLRRREGRAREPHEVALAGIRATGHPRERGVARAGEHRPVAGRPRSGGNGRGRPAGVDVDTARENVVAGIGGFATGRFTTPEEVAT